MCEYLSIFIVVVVYNNNNKNQSPHIYIHINSYHQADPSELIPLNLNFMELIILKNLLKS